MAQNKSQKRRGKGQIKAIPLFTVEAGLKRRLRRHLKSLGFQRSANGALIPPDPSKSGIRQLHAFQRREMLLKSQDFVARNLPLLSKYFADGRELVPERIRPRLELIESGTFQSDLFRLASLTWSVPVSQGYGRRMRFLVWDDSNDKLMGILALGDPVFNLRMRDQLIGWTLEARRDRLVNILDAYVLGALPPYNMLLGGKLVASLIRTREVKDIFSERYRMTEGLISGKQKKASLVMVTTSSSMGRSSLYNRLTLAGQKYFRPIGYSEGWGHFHIPDQLFSDMREYLARKKHPYARNHRFGQGPNWKLRTVRQALQLLGENQDILRHSVNRELFVCELATNAMKFLRGESMRPHYRGLLSAHDVAELAKARWIVPRADRTSEYRKWRRSELALLLDPATPVRSSTLTKPKPAMRRSTG